MTFEPGEAELSQAREDIVKRQMQNPGRTHKQSNNVATRKIQ